MQNPKSEAAAGDDGAGVAAAAPLTRKQKRQQRKKDRRRRIRRAAAVAALEAAEAIAADPEEQLRLKRIEEEEAAAAEEGRRLYEEREKAFLEAIAAKKAAAEAAEKEKAAARELKSKEENTKDAEDSGEWEYVEDGPAEIIWKGNEIIVKKKKVKVPKGESARKVLTDEEDRPTSNPLPPPNASLHFFPKEPALSAQAVLEKVAQETPKFGTEQDKAHCPFHLKTGACRFGVRCSRVHFYPEKSCTLLVKNMYSGPGLSTEQDEGLEHTDEEIERSYEEFYEDVHTEFLKFGELQNFKVCRNSSYHLRGNVYVQYKSQDSAVDAYNNMNGRYFAGKQLVFEFVSITKWKSAICGEFMKSKFKTCSHGSACNFIHCFRNPGGDYEWADWDNPPPKFWMRKMAALFGISDETVQDTYRATPDYERRRSSDRNRTNERFNSKYSKGLENYRYNSDKDMPSSTGSYRDRDRRQSHDRDRDSSRDRDRDRRDSSLDRQKRRTEKNGAFELIKHDEQNDGASYEYEHKSSQRERDTRGVRNSKKIKLHSPDECEISQERDSYYRSSSIDDQRDLRKHGKRHELSSRHEHNKTRRVSEDSWDGGDGYSEDLHKHSVQRSGEHERLELSTRSEGKRTHQERDRRDESDNYAEEKHKHYVQRNDGNEHEHCLEYRPAGEKYRNHQEIDDGMREKDDEKSRIDDNTPRHHAPYTDDMLQNESKENLRDAAKIESPVDETGHMKKSKHHKRCRRSHTDKDSGVTEDSEGTEAKSRKRKAERADDNSDSYTDEESVGTRRRKKSGSGHRSAREHRKSSRRRKHCSKRSKDISDSDSDSRTLFSGDEDLSRSSRRRKHCSKRSKHISDSDSDGKTLSSGDEHHSRSSRSERLHRRHKRVKNTDPTSPVAQTFPSLP